MHVLKFVKKQTVIWFRNNIENAETDYYPGDEVIVEILCKEMNMPKHQKDPIYFYTVKDTRGRVGVVCEYLNEPLKVRSLEDVQEAS